MNLENIDLMGLTIFLTLLFGVFVLLYPRISKGANKQSEFNKIENPFKSDGKNKGLSEAQKIVIIAGVVSIFIGISYLFTDKPPSHTGRWSWVIYPIYKLAGNLGVSIWFSFIGVIAVIWVFHKNK